MMGRVAEEILRIGSRLKRNIHQVTTPRSAVPGQIGDRGNTLDEAGLLGMLFSGGGPGGNRKDAPAKNAATKEGFRTLYIMKDGQPTQIAVKTGVTDGDMTQVLEGPLTAGDVVITAQTAGTK